MSKKDTARNDVIGRVHSIETCGTVDGPGMRYVVFTQGCPLRCVFCHNPDTREFQGGQEMNARDIIKDALHYKVFFEKTGGGITVSGGEPLMQPEFVREIFRLAHENGLHTTLDTSGCCDLSRVLPLIEETDLVLLGLKSFNRQTFRQITNGNLDPSLRFAEALAGLNKPVWLRYVLVPGLTDEPSDLRRLAKFVADMPNIQRVEILPFHKMGEYKWDTLGLPYTLHDVKPPSRAQIETAIGVLRSEGLRAVMG